jgi:hypothetical protein
MNIYLFLKSMVCRFCSAAIKLLAILAIASTNSLATADTATAEFSEAFGGTTISEDGSTFNFPSGAEGWGGFANMNTDMYPLQFSSDGSITFNASVANGDTATIRFRLEFNPHPDVDPAFDAAAVTVSGSAVSSYTVAIPSQGANTFSSLIMNINERDVPVTISDVVVNGEVAPPVDTVNVTFQVDMSAEETNPDGVYLAAGGVFGQEGVLMTDNGSDVWTATVDLSANSQVLYKFRNQPSYGTWDGFEDPAGLIAGGCNSGEYNDRSVYVGEADIVLPVVSYGSCTEDHWEPIRWQDSIPYPPEPAESADSVLSIFSSTYGNLEGTDFNPNWGQNTNVEVGDNLIYNFLNYQGTQFAVQDVSGYAYLNIDYYVEDSTSVNFFLISPGAEIAYALDVSTAGQWNRVKIPLSHYADIVDLGDVFQFKVDGNGAIAFNNIYFGEEALLGCTDFYAINFTEGATFDDGSCEYPDTAIFNSPFGGIMVEGNTYTFPSYAEPWAAVANNNDGLYPISLENGGTLTFTGLADTDVNVRFRFEYMPHQNDSEQYDTATVTVTEGSADYSIDLDAQGSNTFSSFLLYVVDRDIPVTISNVKVTAGLEVRGCTDAAADNYNADAIVDDGSCTYTNASVSVTFQVDMYGVDTSNGVSVMGGPIFGQAGLAMSDDDGDNVWTVTTEFDANTTVTFKYRNTTALTWDNQESVPVDCAHGEWGDRLVDIAEDDIVLNITPYGECYYEQSISVSNSPKGILGKPVVFEVSYDTNSNNNQLTGLGLRVHFDSSILSYSQITNLIEQDIIVRGQGPFNDEDDFDNDPLTDQYILFGWASLYNNWPNVELPAVLMNIAFDVLTGINTDEIATTSINFTETALAADHQFGANTYELELVALTWDFDGNGVADALTDGLMMLRYHFGLRGEYVTENAMAVNSPLSSEEVIAEMEAAFEISDIDNDGEIEALTDSLMLLRYLFGLRGDVLTAGAVSFKANRSSNEEIEAYIEAYMP